MDSAASRQAPAPLVSIGVPVFNAERFLARALDSLLGQTFTDLELIISDNASTDGTRAICEDYLRRDKRVRYIRQQTNIGAPRNWNVVAHAARGTFFKWASANDYCSPLLVERSVAVLQADPDVVLCFGQTLLVDEDDKPIALYDRDTAVDDDRPSDRFARVCSLLALNNLQSGMSRLEVLRRTRMDRLYPSGDMAMTAELALYGRLHMIPELLLYRRQSRGTYTTLLRPLEQQRIYDPDARAPMRFIRLRRHLDHLVSISRSPLSIAEKLCSIRIALRFARWDRVGLWREFVPLNRDANNAP